MKGKFLFATGLAAGYVLGSRSGRAAYDKLKARSAELWQSKPVQDKVAVAAETLKEKAPEVSGQLGEAARRAGTVISSAVHRDAGKESTSAATQGTTAPGTSVPVAPDVRSDPALSDQDGQDWSDEGGATPSGPATSADPDKLP
ncbi:hypothetical protein [Arthrobacter sp. 131MFCol6.1]|uniref:hypothetical protein n=1 Tax=Arthrobacter sp. 131MFCol6.1 TaxID=1157944 RepID=UPI0003799975|nr:hypothetical protein [Arthrobacter sp. 131MFCol6.1]